ncbi:unnamed protein product [Amoebophrya sp. A25]|nr:unnamed protein product [Amoebophrya sp. A25]|eukprot:GSA25T00011523001.1
MPHVPKISPPRRASLVAPPAPAHELGPVSVNQCEALELDAGASVPTAPASSPRASSPNSLGLISEIQAPALDCAVTCDTSSTLLHDNGDDYSMTTSGAESSSNVASNTTEVSTGQVSTPAVRPHLLRARWLANLSTPLPRRRLLLSSMIDSESDSEMRPGASLPQLSPVVWSSPGSMSATISPTSNM